MQTRGAHTKVRCEDSCNGAQAHDRHRQETAASVTHLAKLVGDAPNLPPEVRVLDLCTGTGCIPLLFRHEFASKQKDVDLRIVGIDISDESMALAHYNLQRHEKDPRARSGMTNFAKADVLANLFADRTEGAPIPLGNLLNHKKWSPFWDILISNPPYISPSAYRKTTTRSVRGYEPKLALVPPPSPQFDDTQQGDMFYPRLLKIADEVEAKVVLLEVADLDQALRVAKLAQNLDTFDGVEIWRDEPNALSGQATIEDGVPVQGQGNARSVVCWRGAGSLWLGKTSTLQAPKPEQNTSQEPLSKHLKPSFSWDPTIVPERPLPAHNWRLLMTSEERRAYMEDLSRRHNKRPHRQHDR